MPRQSPSIRFAFLALLACAHLADASAGFSTSHTAQHGRGLAQANDTKSQFTLISVIGERNSGTNFVRKLLENNLDPGVHTVMERFTQHKHYMQDPPPEGTRPYHLIVVCTRNAYDWILSLQYKCYCCNKREREDFWRFVSAPYVATEFSPDNPLCPNVDRDIANGGRPFKNLLDMRVQKIQNHLNLTKYTGGVELVRLEDVLTREASLTWLQGFVQKYHLKLQEHPATTPTPCNGSGKCAKHHRHHTMLRAVDGDARAWHANKTTTSRSRTAASLYLNRDKLNIPVLQYYQYRDKISIINALIDHQFEASIGYDPMIVTYPPPEYQQSPARRRRRHQRYERRS